MLHKELFVLYILNFFYIINGNFNVTYDFTEALEQCEKHNKSLAYLNKTLIPKNISSIGTYFGLKYVPKERFIWMNGNLSIPDLVWDNNILYDDKIRCAYITPNGTINFNSCKEKMNYLCSNVTNNDLKRKTLEECREGYFYFFNGCYKMNLKYNVTYNRKDASTICKKDGGSLVVVRNFQENEFITALMMLSPAPVWTDLTYYKVHSNITIWISNSTKTLAPYSINFKKGEPNGNEKERCLMVYHRLGHIGEINDENCSKQLNYICKTDPIQIKQKQNTKKVKNIQPPIFFQGKCNESYYEFNETCYQIAERKGLCKMNNSVSVLYGRIDVAFIRSLMILKNVTSVKVNVNKNMLSYPWIQLEGKLKVSNLNCVILHSNSNKVNSCENYKGEFRNICHYKLPQHEDKNGLLCPSDWIKVGTRCYMVGKTSERFNEANNYCKRNNGSLATFRTMKEVVSVRHILNDDAWIGITGVSYLKHQWIDGTNISYTLYRHTTDLNHIKKNSKKVCFVLKKKNGEWDDKDCNNYKDFICEKKAIENPCLPIKFPHYINGSCYRYYDDPSHWVDAERNCRNVHVHSHLAYFSNAEEEEAVIRAINTTKKMWIGLRKDNYMLQWSNGLSLSYKRNFISGDVDYQFSCFLSYEFKKMVKWQRENCAHKKGYICKYDSRFPLKPRRLEPSKAYGTKCPGDYFYWQGYCYKYFENLKTWKEATSFCTRDFRGKLASFETTNDYYYVLGNLRRSNINIYMTWIGYYIHEGAIVSVDENHDSYKRGLTMRSKYDYQIRAGANAENDRIALITNSNPYLNGDWVLANKDMQFPFICRVFPLSDHQVRKQTCPKEYRYGTDKHCYSIGETEESFDVASRTCEQMGASLLVIDDIHEENLLNSLITPQHRTFWLGIRTTKASSKLNIWRTVENKTVMYTHWKLFPQLDMKGTKFPHNTYNGCWIIRLGHEYEPYLKNEFVNEQYSGFDIVSCSIKLNFICKLRKETKNETEKEYSSSPLCGKLRNGTRYKLDVIHTVSNEPCVRWDLQNFPLDYMIKTKLESSKQFNKHGFVSYSANRCSRILGDESTPYGCKVYKNNKFQFEECNLVPCPSPSSSKRKILSVGNIFADLLFFVLLVLLIFFLILYHRRILNQPIVQVCLSRSLGRFKPDWMSGSRPPPATTANRRDYRHDTVMYRHQQNATDDMNSAAAGGGSGGGIAIGSGGVGFVNPGYSPLPTNTI